MDTIRYPSLKPNYRKRNIIIEKGGLRIVLVNDYDEDGYPLVEMVETSDEVIYDNDPEKSEINFTKILPTMQDNDMLNPSIHKRKLKLIRGSESPLAIKTISYDFNTKNKSFLNLYRDYVNLGIKNNKFFLAIIDTTLIGVDPYDKTLPVETKLRIALECQRNPWYWLREVCRVPSDGKPIEIGGGSEFLIDRNSCASWYVFLNNIDQYVSKPRQTGKTHCALSEIDWAYHHGSRSATFTFANKDATNNRMNLYRLKCHRDMLPAYLQQKVVIDENGNLIKEKNSVTTMRNPLNSNSIILLPRANSAESANANGRGMTSSLQYFDEFDFEAWNTTTLKSSAFAFATAHRNALQSGSVSSRIFTSTPGDLDTRDGASAAEFISHMLVWRDEFLDMPIEWLMKEARDAEQERNGIIYIEHTWRQLKKTDRWYREQCQLVSYDRETIMREIDLKRLHGSSLSPFDREDILYLIDHVKEPKEYKRYPVAPEDILIYEDIRREVPYILAVDPSEGLGTDNNSMQLINPYTLASAAEFECNYISQPVFSKLVCQFMDDYCPNAMIIIENNRGREMINCIRSSKYMFRLWYDNDKMLEVKEKVNQYGSEVRDAYERRAYGLSTSGHNRPQMYSILEKFVREEKKSLVGKKLVAAISCLIRKPGTGKIEAGGNGHDDAVMAYLIGIYVYLYAQNLETFGIHPGMSDPLLDPIHNIKKKEDPMEQLRAIYSSLPPEMQALIGPSLMEKTDQQRAAQYNREVQMAKAQNEITRLMNPNNSGYWGNYYQDQNSNNYIGQDQWASFDNQIIKMNDDPSLPIFDINNYI